MYIYTCLSLHITIYIYIRMYLHTYNMHRQGGGDVLPGRPRRARDRCRTSDPEPRAEEPRIIVIVSISISISISVSISISLSITSISLGCPSLPASRLGSARVRVSGAKRASQPVDSRFRTQSGRGRIFARAEVGADVDFRPHCR